MVSGKWFDTSPQRRYVSGWSGSSDRFTVLVSVIALQYHGFVITTLKMKAWADTVLVFRLQRLQLAMPPRRAAESTETVAANVARLRASYRMSLRDLATALGEVGLTISAQSLSAIEKGNTAITVDQLTAFSSVLNVSPMALLMPWTDDAYEPDVALTGTGRVYPVDVWEWLSSTRPLDQPVPSEQQNVSIVLAFRNRCRPPWVRRAEEL